MRRMKSIVGAAAIFLNLSLLLCGTALAQYRPWPSPLPPEPAWGDYDNRRVFRDAGWWWQNQPDWARQHHPEWWGDFDDRHDWQPAGWWLRKAPGWVREQHPEGGGDLNEGDG